MNDQVKQEFEKWFKKIYGTESLVKSTKYEYALDYTQSAWEAWQAGFIAGQDYVKEDIVDLGREE